MANKNNAGTAIGVGVGVAAAAAAAAGGAYWLYGAKHSAQHRKLAKSWMLKARAEVIDAIEKLEDVDKERYMNIVDGVIKNYAGQGASTAEITHMMRDFKTAWGHMEGKKKTGKKTLSKGKRTVKKAAKKAKRRVSKK